MKKIVIVSIVFLCVMFLYVALIPVVRQNPLEHYETPLMNNGLVSDVVYKHNTDLDYASVRWGIPISAEMNRKTQQIAPILNPAVNRPFKGELWGSAPAAQNTTRIPDFWSNNKVYNHRIVSQQP